MWQRAAMPCARQVRSIVARRSKCKNCKQMYLLNLSVCASTYCSLDCQSNFQYLEHVSGRLRSYFEEAKNQHAVETEAACGARKTGAAQTTATASTAWPKPRGD
ncbi:Aste57867_11455 [Aphanomyces stellatus]|uniref:Aste57867_11455 protein n=1 Tax=Aphanomyces stellatus TaxID=120398 RepID=A0A485KTL9_9STRA|nr:hypothetical protein As57867_011412 [Aphanomyces stellatus]VFT88316.1 Aste57867_11455 [Aphanomyces stellatus]